eukprot:gene14363-20363_t
MGESLMAGGGNIISFGGSGLQSAPQYENGHNNTSTMQVQDGRQGGPVLVHLIQLMPMEQEQFMNQGGGSGPGVHNLAHHQWQQLQLQVNQQGGPQQQGPPIQLQPWVNQQGAPQQQGPPIQLQPWVNQQGGPQQQGPPIQLQPWVQQGTGIASPLKMLVCQ